MGTGLAQHRDLPFRKQLKDEAKRLRAARSPSPQVERDEKAPNLDHWKLTVGLEIHAQLNARRKLFSSQYAKDNKGTQP